MKDHNVSICCVTETWLTLVRLVNKDTVVVITGDKAKFAEIHDFGFDVISAPRKGRGGGVAFLYNPKMINPVRNDVKKYSSFEVIECVIKSSQKLIRFCTVYRSTQTKDKYNDTKVHDRL